MTIDEVIAELTNAGDVERVCLAADIGCVVGIEEVEWVFIGGGRRKTVTVPRPAFSYTRESGRNFWLVEMPVTFAKMFEIEDFVLTADEADEHRERMKGA